MEPVKNSNDFLEEYRAISTKIKKRFLKKPNIAEASENFSKLARKLNEGEAWPQSGLCCMAVAQCEKSVSNPSAEASAVADAARYFMKAETLNHSLMCPGYNEHSISAVSCYETAIKLFVHQEKPALAASLAVEASKALVDVEKPSEAVLFLDVALPYLKNSPGDYLSCLSEKASCKINLGDLDAALTLFLELLSLVQRYEKTPSGYFNNICTNAEICGLLLLLTLRPLSQHMKPEQKKLIEKYTCASDELMEFSGYYEDPELVLILQSLVCACEADDVESVAALSPHLSPKLSGQSLHLLHVLLKERGTPN